MKLAGPHPPFVNRFSHKVSFFCQTMASIKVRKNRGCIFTCIAWTCYHRQVYAVAKGVGSS